VTPVVLDPDLDSVVKLNPVLDSPTLDPVSDPRPSVPLDPVDLRSPAPVLDPVPADASAGPVPEPRCSLILGPATVQLASVKKPQDEVSVDSSPSPPDQQ
jgi:hypothetical protein